MNREHPLLCRYLHAEFGLYPKRIDEKRASNRNGPRGNIWLFPDIVAMEDLGADTMNELRLLAAAHGIGLIVLDVEDPTEGSEIRIPARERAEVDWDTCNRLAEENADFREFIRLVRQFHQTDDVKRGDWDLPADES